VTNRLYSSIQVASTSRADYRALKVLAQALLAADFDVSFSIWPGLDSLEEVQRRAATALADGLPAMLPTEDSPTPELLMVLGDRPEVLSIALAAMVNQVPVLHVHGGEETTGSVDNLVRHALTKLSHVHFVAHPDYAHRVLQMGEEPWRVEVVGAPALDDLQEWLEYQGETDIVSLRKSFGFNEPYLMFSYHPDTIDTASLGQELQAMEAAMRELKLPVAWVGPNGDPGSDQVKQVVEKYSWKSAHPLQYFDNLEPDEYAQLMLGAQVMVGNSSAGIIEAPSFGLNVVNIGSRQNGRVRATSNYDCEPEAQAIIAGIRAQMDRQKIAENPFWQEGAGPKVVSAVESLPDRMKLLHKEFVDW